MTPIIFYLSRTHKFSEDFCAWIPDVKILQNTAFIVPVYAAAILFPLCMIKSKKKRNQKSIEYNCY